MMSIFLVVLNVLFFPNYRRDESIYVYVVSVFGSVVFISFFCFDKDFIFRDVLF